MNNYFDNEYKLETYILQLLDKLGYDTLNSNGALDMSFTCLRLGHLDGSDIELAEDA